MKNENIRYQSSELSAKATVLKQEKSNTFYMVLLIS